METIKDGSGQEYYVEGGRAIPVAVYRVSTRVTVKPRVISPWAKFQEPKRAWWQLP
jgi:hypothetical protein